MSEKRRLVVILLCLLVVLCCGRGRAEDPFQSAPGPEAPRPKPHPRTSPSLETTPVAPAPAPAPPSADETYVRHAPSGVAARLNEHSAYNPDCTPRPVEVRIVVPPHNGTATIREETLTISATSRFGTAAPVACVGRPTASQSIYYQSSPGFRGADRVGYLVNRGQGEWKHVEIQISVD
jgi:hypothetical protein